MKKLNYTIFILLTFIFLAESKGQIAGYMGKRFTVEYANYFSPAISPTAFTYDPPGLNSVHCLNLDYVIKPRTNFCISGQYMRTGIVVQDHNNRIYPQVNYIGSKDKGLNLQSINVGMGFKFFRRGSIAPLGKYVKFELLIFIETLTLDSKEFTQVDGTTNNINPYRGETIFNFHNAALTFTLGKQRVFFNKLVFDYGLRAGVAPAFILNNMFVDYHRTLESQFRSDTQLRILGEQFLNIHIGIGFLAF